MKVQKYMIFSFNVWRNAIEAIQKKKPWRLNGSLYVRIEKMTDVPASY